MKSQYTYSSRRSIISFPNLPAISFLFFSFLASESADRTYVSLVFRALKNRTMHHVHDCCLHEHYPGVDADVLHGGAAADMFRVGILCAFDWRFCGLHCMELQTFLVGVAFGRASEWDQSL